MGLAAREASPPIPPAPGPETQTELAALDATKTLLGEYPILGTVDENEAEDTGPDSFHWTLSQPLSAESEGQDRIKIKAGSRPRITVPNMKPRAY